MENRVAAKVNEYQTQFKLDIKKWVDALEGSEMELPVKSSLLKYIFDYEALKLESVDFARRTRIKSHVEHYLRCSALKAGGEQCTRRKKNDSCYCGTHDKSRPHGAIEKGDVVENKLTKINVWPQEIKGILYYIDNNNNIYKTEDIVSNKINPRVVAEYTIDATGGYVLLE
jgi:hypothetical protein